MPARRPVQRAAWPLPAVPALAAISLALAPTAAFAHASDRGHVLLLPTGYYVAGGALAVAISFLALVALPGAGTRRARPRAVELARLPASLRLWTSWLSFLCLLVLLAAGIWGSRDPLSNPLPLTVWTLVWIGLTLLQGLVGNLWAWIDPWYGPARLLAPVLPAKHSYPARLGAWPAVLFLFAFAWFELVDTAPDDPFRLAVAVGLYWLLAFAGVALFGHAAWSERGEFLSVFFRLISAYAVVSGRRDADQIRILAGPPGHKPDAGVALAPSETALLLAALASVSFDGFMRTFTWLAAIGVNPLEFPGRSALVLPNTLGLAAAVLCLGSLYLLCVAAGQRLAASRKAAAGAMPLQAMAGRLVWSLVPIALAFHFAHYLVSLLVNGQYALVALSDPFALGWDLFGTADRPVAAGIAMGSDAAWLLWNVQAGVIVLGHVAAVLVCHAACMALYADRRAAMRAELPLTLLMVGYTVFGLWLLSTPTGA
jgi:hypothetical protein